MKRVEKLAAVHVGGLAGAERVMALGAFEAGFGTALELAAYLLAGSWSNPRYCGLHFQDALQAIRRDILSIREEICD